MIITKHDEGFIVMFPRIQDTCKKLLANYAWPQEIIIKEDFPYLASGKSNIKAMERDIKES